MDQLQHIVDVQTHWSDNSVSCTVYYRKEELPAIQAWLREHYQTKIKSVSFLLHKEHGFQQAILEEIPEAEYRLLVAQLKNPRLSSFPSSSSVIEGSAEETLLSQHECTNGSCPVR